MATALEVMRRGIPALHTSHDAAQLLKTTTLECHKQLVKVGFGPSESSGVQCQS